MKKYLHIILVATATLALVSCQKEVGTLSGNDTDPYAVLSTFAPGDNFDPACDIAVRFTANNATTDLFYLTEKTDEKTARKMTDDQYADYVIANGTKLNTSVSAFDGSQTADMVLKGLFGDNTISVVASNGNKKHLASTTFFGLNWITIAEGTFTPGKLSALGIAPVKTKLQKCEQIEGQYRFPNLFKQGYNYVFNTVGELKEDGEGKSYYNVSLGAQETGLTYGNYGSIFVRDVATWQSNESYLSNNKFYPESNYVKIWAQNYVTAGNIGYGYDTFTAD